jgi:hypothetical protein
MKKSMINQVHLEGRIFSHDLQIKTVQNADSTNFGKEFIAGNVEIAVDEEGMNVIPVHFTYVTETTKSGAKSPTYTALKKIIDENRTWSSQGKDKAQKIQVNSALALNDFYNANDELVSAKVNEGGFVTLLLDSAELRPEKERNTFNTDIVITSVKKVEKDEEKNIPEDYDVIRGAIFNFRNEILPLEYTIKLATGMKYFEDKAPSASAPLFTRVWGNINSKTKTVTQTQESAFGEAAVTTYTRKEKEWLITGALNEAYDFGDEAVLTAEELKKAMQDREVRLADIKKRADEYKAQKASATPGPIVTGSASQGGTFNF